MYEVTDGRIQTVDYYVDRLQAAKQLVMPVALGLAAWRAACRMQLRLSRSRHRN